MKRQDDVLEIRSICEREMQVYGRSQKSWEDVRDLCTRVALAAAGDAYPRGYSEGVEQMRALARRIRK